MFPQFPHKIAKCSLRPASIPQSQSYSHSLPASPPPGLSICLSERHLSALSGHRYSFRWLLTVVVAAAAVDHNELENYAWYSGALSKRKLCNQFVQLGCLEYVTEWPQSTHFGGISGRWSGCRECEYGVWSVYKSFNRIGYRVSINQSLIPSHNQT